MKATAWIHRTLPLAVLLAGCEEETIAPDIALQPNRPPVVSGSIPDQRVAGLGNGHLDVSGYFSDPDGDSLAYTAASSDTSAVTISMAGSVATLTGNGAGGRATVTVTAGDPNGAVARTVFVVQSINDPEQAGLVALYEATGGANWKHHDNWLTTKPLRDWHGVTVNEDGRVTSLELDRNGLTGEIPPELGNLTALESLDFYSNDLGGEIPTKLGNLTALEWLDLGNNNLSAPLPPELGNLTALVGLHLNGNDLAGEIPPDWGNLTKLWSLNLGNNDLTGPIPPELGNLTALVRLSLNGNDLTGPIPPELGRLVNLEQLYLSGNDLTDEIPAELWSLTALEDLVLNGNDLAGEIPAELGNLTALRMLWLDGNNLTGPLPSELLNLQRLRSLGVFETSLCLPGTDVFFQWTERGLDSFHGEAWCNDADRAMLKALYEVSTGPSWKRADNWLQRGPVLSDWYGVTADSLGRVVALSLPANNLAGHFPPVPWATLEELRVLDVADNPRLRGPFPLSLARVPLDTLLFQRTSLCTYQESAGWLASIPFAKGTGEMCASLSDRDILVTLYEATGGEEWVRRKNWLTDAPLEEWQGVTVNEDGRVTSLYLDFRNGLTGEIPPELGSLTMLESLNLRHNGLTGGIPPEVGKLTVLESLDLRDNALTGGIPPELGNLTALETLDLGDNDLTGPIPPTLGHLTAALERLHLGGNDLTGPIPPVLGNLPRLKSLYLAGNSLAGRIPSALGQLTALERLHLGGNDLTGPIPPALGHLAALEWLNLSRNDLTGPIPSALGQLTALEGLYLGDNDMTGPIPAELGNLTALERLSLSSNDLTGPIPPELGSLTLLKWLLLDNNEGLTGSLPPELGKLTALEWLLLDNNEGLSGVLPTTLTALKELSLLIASNTGLCVPADPGFRRWATAVVHFRVRQCLTKAAYLVQAVQSRDYPVPLVAGRDALLRVFPTAPAGTSVPVPPVRASFYSTGGASTVYTVDIVGKPSPLPAEIDEGNLAASANVEIPGNVLRPGLEMVVEIDPEGTLDPALGISQRLPAEGRTALDIRDLPVMELTFVPFLWTEDPDSSILAPVEAIAADPEGHELLQLPRAVLPAHEWTVAAHDAVWTDIQPVWVNRLGLLRLTAAIRAMEDGNGHWMGVPPTESFGGGVASGDWITVSVLGSRIIAHELGHNLSLDHAPCGKPSYRDPLFPDPYGRIGAWGYNFATDKLVPPNRPDVMSYCRSLAWISDYHFGNALRHRQRVETAARAHHTSAMLLWGGNDAETGAYLEPAFIVDAPPWLPEQSGPWTIEGRDTGGRMLFSLPFAMPEIADANEGAGSFAYTLPVRPGWENLASVTLSGPGGTATLDSSTNRPMSIWRERDGTVRAILSGDPVQADGGLGGPLAGVALDVLTSRGIPSPAIWRR